VLDACRDAASERAFPEAGPPCRTIRDANVAGSGNPAYFVDITATIDAGIASLREHRARLDGLGLRRYPMGLSPYSRVRSSEFISASTVARTEPTSKANVAPARLNSSGTVAVAPIRSAER
jgi:hypothetical protein